MPGPSITGAQLQAGAQTYQNNLNALAAQTSFGYALVPQFGNYVGNGTNDAWNKGEALEQTYSQLNLGFNFTTDHSDAALAALKSILTAAQTAEGSAANDFDHVFGVNGLDNAAITHDEDHGNAMADNNLGGEIAANENFAAAAVAQFFVDGNPFDLGAAAFIGIGATAFDVVSYAFNTAVQAISAIVSDVASVFGIHSATAADESTFTENTVTATTDAADAGYTSEASYDNYGFDDDMAFGFGS